jgi:outer membrane protein assembly factor BamB
VLYAYDATSLTAPIWSSPLTGSSSTSNDVAGNAVKFTVPTIANGKVYVGTRGSNSGAAYVSACSGSSATNACGELDVYGLSN